MATSTNSGFLGELERMTNEMRDNFFTRECRISMEELCRITGLSIRGHMYLMILHEFYKIIPQEITPAMLVTTIQHIDTGTDSSPLEQYIVTHDIDASKRMRSNRNVYKIIKCLLAGHLQLPVRPTSKHQKLIDLVHPILYQLCDDICFDYISH